MLGYGGLTLKRLQSGKQLAQLEELQPDIVILELGTNDVGANRRPETVGSEIDDLVNHLISAIKVKVVGVCLVIHRHKYMSIDMPYTSFNFSADLLNHYLEVVLDDSPSPGFTWKHRDLQKSQVVLCEDGVHLNKRGQYLLYSICYTEVIEALC